MTAPARARIRAPWIALPLALVTLLGATPAFADEIPDAAPPAVDAPVAETPAPEAPPAEIPPAEPAPESSPEPTPEPTETPAEPESDVSSFDVHPFALAAAAVVTPSFEVSPSTGLDDGDAVTVSVTLPATITSTAGAELVTGVYVMYCVQPSGTIGTAGGRATGAQCDATRQQYLVAGTGPAGGTVAGSVTDGAWTFSTPVLTADSFGAHECLAASATGEQCGVFIRLYHGFSAGNVADPYRYDTFLPVTFDAPPPVYTPGITVTPTTGLTDGAALTVTGALPATITGTAGSALTTGVYLMYCVQPTGTVGTAGGRATGAQCDATRQQYLVAASGPAGGTVAGTVTSGVWNFTATITAADSFGLHECLSASATGEQCGVFVRLYHGFNAGNLANPYQYDQFVPVTFAAPVVPGGPGTPGTPGTPGLASPALSISPSTVDPSVATTVTIRGAGYTGAGAANGVYVNIGSSSTWKPGQVPSTGGWIASGWVQPGALTGGAFTTQLTIPAGALVAGGSYGVATFAAHALALTDRSLDVWKPLTLVAAGTGTAAETRTAAATPPADEGIDLESDEADEGGEVSASATGFQPNEQGILVVIYSDPVVLDSTATADADGAVHWTGRLPAGLTGDHTLTFQGSIDVGVPIRITERAALGCTVDDARLDWGFKESFRAYIDGSIANGEWTTAGDAGYETPAFFWTSGVGDYDPESREGVAGFGGSVRFTGHGGALDTTIANPRIELDGDTGILLLDVAGTTQDGRELTRVAVPFAALDLSGSTSAVADGVVTQRDVPATLTPEGADVFGTYAAGETLDPVTLALPVADCGAATPAEVTATGESTTTGVPAWLIWAIVAALLATAVIAAVVVLRRRRAGA